MHGKLCFNASATEVDLFLQFTVKELKTYSHLRSINNYLYKNRFRLSLKIIYKIELLMINSTVLVS